MVSLKQQFMLLRPQVWTLTWGAMSNGMNLFLGQVSEAMTLRYGQRKPDPSLRRPKLQVAFVCQTQFTQISNRNNNMSQYNPMCSCSSDGIGLIIFRCPADGKHCCATCSCSCGCNYGSSNRSVINTQSDSSRIVFMKHAQYMFSISQMAKPLLQMK